MHVLFLLIIRLSLCFLDESLMIFFVCAIVVSRFSLRNGIRSLVFSIIIISLVCKDKISVQHTRRTMGRIRGWTDCVPWFFPRIGTQSAQCEYKVKANVIITNRISLYRVNNSTEYTLLQTDRVITRTDSSTPIDRVGIGFPFPPFFL